MLPVDSKANTILILGDSLSAAYGMDMSLGWVHLLQQRLADLPTNWQVINASVSGETSSGGRARLPALLAKHKPDICVIELGANDGLRGQAIAQMQQNLSAIISKCQTMSAAILLLGMRLPPNYGEQYTQMFADCYAKLAAQYKIDLVPFLLQGVSERPTLMQADGLHPSAAAQPIILETIWPAMQKLLAHK